MKPTLKKRSRSCSATATFSSSSSRTQRSKIRARCRRHATALRNKWKSSVRLRRSTNSENSRRQPSRITVSLTTSSFSATQTAKIANMIVTAAAVTQTLNLNKRKTQRKTQLSKYNQFMTTLSSHSHRTSQTKSGAIYSCQSHSGKQRALLKPASFSLGKAKINPALKKIRKRFPNQSSADRPQNRW